MKVLNLRDRWAMSNFRALFSYAIEQPLACNQMLTRNCRESEPYPAQYAAIFLLGMIQGVLIRELNGDFRMTLAEMEQTHEDFQKVGAAPDEFIGPNRKWGKQGQL
jgi:hypothetical protein